VIADGSWSSPDAAIEQAVRTGLAILTEGVLVAPLEGMTGVKVKTNADGSTYVDVYFSGPIRAAGGTAEALSVLIADVARRSMGIGPYKATSQEIERFKEEIPAYKRAQHLQYTPTSEEVELIVSNLPVSVNGEGTEKVEISGFRDLPRVETNRLRGGACLVIAEGLCLKAPKVLKHVRRLGLEGWEFLADVEPKKAAEAGPRPQGPAAGPPAPPAGEADDGEGAEDEAPDPGEGGEAPEETDEDGGDTLLPAKGGGAGDATAAAGPTAAVRGPARYIRDLIAGRPVFSHPSRPGGFRLRYGRARTTGLAALAVHPVTMHVLRSFLAVGTQMKIERPGKAGAVTPCDTIEGPIVALESGDVVEVRTMEEFRVVEKQIAQILDVGEILVPFGEFVENNKELAPGAWCFEWWAAELAARAPGVDPEAHRHAPLAAALALSREHGVGLHPDHTFMWHDLTAREVDELAGLVAGSGVLSGDTLTLDAPPRTVELLWKLTLPHRRRGGLAVVEGRGAALAASLGLEAGGGGRLRRARRLPPHLAPDAPGHEAVSALLGVRVRPKAPTRIGARMGRPEKARERMMKPPVHALFPIGGAGGGQRLVKEAARQAQVEVEVASRRCAACGRKWPTPRCLCGGATEATGTYPRKVRFPVAEMLQAAKDDLGMAAAPDVKGVRGLISAEKIPEAIHKGLLRAKHGVFVFRDGTVRFDLTDVPVTHVRLGEIALSPERARELGYAVDHLGAPLERPDQLIELRPQDVVLSKACGEYLLRVAAFVDEELERFYRMEPFYRARAPEDLVGALVIGLAPHTSGGVLARILGFTSAHVAYAHPFFHAAKRRNCDGDEDSLMLLLEGFLNFSRKFLPSSRGGQMDAPLVLSVRIDPNEIDKEAHNIDVAGAYPLALFEAAERGAHPNEVAALIDTVGGRIGTPRQYEGFAFTHDTADISAGPARSAYSEMGSMVEKMEAQLDLATCIRAVDAADVAARVIETHFLPDLVGNMKAFSRQGVRCGNAACGRKYRRVPLKGECLACGGPLLLLVHEASVKKYLEVTRGMVEKYAVSDYIRQRVALAEESINALFENDKVRRTKIEDFMA
ncbi:MAG TPA: DNA polymerase II large subunit, partial [Candidatus Thermoplasmatota archaeon]